jgi:signal transduction histidine kinase
MQTGPILLLAAPTLAVLAGHVLLRAQRRTRAAMLRAGAAERVAGTRARCMSLAAAELRGPGLHLLERAGRGEAGLEGVAQQILRIADDLAEAAAEPVVRALNETPSPLGLVVDSALATVEAQIRPGRRYWQVDPGLRALLLRADRRALEGAVATLLRRAARHSRDGDIVVLRHVVTSETVALVVEDEGDGLSAPDLMAEAAGPGGGTRGLDLGLSLARSLAEAHGGDIRVESTPGVGARAWLTLPRERLMRET